MWGWQPTRLGPACRRGCPRPPSGSAHGPTEPKPVREQEGALWCLLKSQVSLHVCGQGSWKREAGAGRTPRPGGWHQSVCGRPGGVSLQAAKSLGPGITEKATQGSNSDLPHGRWILYQLSYKGSSGILEWVVYPFFSCSQSLPLSCLFQ